MEKWSGMAWVTGALAPYQKSHRNSTRNVPWMNVTFWTTLGTATDYPFDPVVAIP